MWALPRRPRNQVDRWDGTIYRRVVVVGGRRTELAITQEGTTAAPELIVDATPQLRTPAEEAEVRSIVDRLLGLQISLGDWYVTSTRDSRLRLLADKFRGVKPPRSFPTARDVAVLQPEQYRAIGFSRQKAAAIHELAGAVGRGRLDLELLAHEDDAEATRCLTDLRGVGRWTAEYVLLRGLGRLHVFPGDDVGAQKGLALWLGHPGSMNYEDVATAVRRWQPYAGFVYLHLLLEGLSQAGALTSAAHPTLRS